MFSCFLRRLLTAFARSKAGPVSALPLLSAEEESRRRDDIEILTERFAVHDAQPFHHGDSNGKGVCCSPYSLLA